MKANTTPNIQLVVMRGEELAEEYMPKEPTVIQVAVSHVQARLQAFSRELATQARLQFFDLIYRTHYARIRRELRREVKKERICRETGIYDLLRVTGHRV